MRLADSKVKIDCVIDGDLVTAYQKPVNIQQMKSELYRIKHNPDGTDDVTDYSDTVLPKYYDAWTYKVEGYVFENIEGKLEPLRPLTAAECQALSERRGEEIKSFVDLIPVDDKIMMMTLKYSPTAQVLLDPLLGGFGLSSKELLSNPKQWKEIIQAAKEQYYACCFVSSGSIGGNKPELTRSKKTVS